MAFYMDKEGQGPLLCHPSLLEIGPSTISHFVPLQASMHRILYLAFALSGGAGLIYEAVWGRYLALFVGHAAYAQVLVIGTYLGGMALGALLVGEGTRKIQAPLLWYAGVEGALAAMAVTFHPLFQGLTGFAYDWMIPSLGTPFLVGVGKWSLAIAILLPQALLLGTTFPLMSAGVLRSFPGSPGRILSLLYFTNSLGASVGVLVGGFYLVARFGLPGSLLAAAGLNLMAAGLAGWVWSVQKRAGRGAGGHGTGSPDLAGTGGRPRGGDAGRPGVPGPGPGAGGSLYGKGRLPAIPGLVRLLLAVSFLTAVASFAYEIGWIRMLSLVMGSATHSFEVMLSAFILGLALGAYFVRTRADAGLDSLTLLGWVQWVMGLAALATLPIYVSTFETMAFLVDFLPATDRGYALFGGARYGIAIAVMLPSTIMAGMTLPLITALLMEAGQGERSIGRVYGFNTLGAVLGVAVSGLLALPILGLKGLILAGAALDMALGVTILIFRGRLGRPNRRPWGPGLALIGAVSAGLVVHLGLEMDERLLLSGVFRYGTLPGESGPVLFYRDGRTATVGVHMSPAQDLAILTTNGKPDASISLRWIRAQAEPLPPRPILFDDEATQTLLALLPLAHAPGARTVAHIGHGSGLTGHAILASPNIERTVTIEIEPEVIAASEAFYPANARVFDDPRSSFVIDDAKAYFASRQDAFDLIISEPSNPWVSGTASLFTVEFYGRIGRFLAPGGLFAQWFHCYEMTDSLVASVLGAVHQVFPHYRGYQVGPGDILVVASMESPIPPPDWEIFKLPAVARMLAHVPSFTPRHLQSLHLFESETLGPFLDDWPQVNSDFHPYLENGAERARFKEEEATGFLNLGSRRVLLSAFLERVPRGFLEDCSEPILGVGPLQNLAVGCWLRRARNRDPAVEAASGTAQRAALETYRKYALHLDSKSPPPDWRGFIRLATEVEEEIHGGTAGAADTLFYDRLFQYLRHMDAPPEAMAAADFLHGVASWDHEGAVRAAEILLKAHARGEEWLPGPLLKEGTVLALLAVGEPERAREVLDRLTPDRAGGGLPVRGEVLRSLVEREGQSGRSED